MLDKTRICLQQAHGLAGDMLKIGYTAAEIISDLVNYYGAAHGYSHGCYYLRLATVEVATANANKSALLSRWMNRAADLLQSESIAA